MTETPRRLAPTREVLRELYLKSGNRCAFPACKRALFNVKGVFVGQVCHIEAAEPGGERYNEDQTNEHRRKVSNLLSMCYDHHIETNDVVKFPVERMRRIKAEHEKTFSDVVGSMLLTVTDHTTLTDPIFALNLEAMNRLLKWESSHSELQDAVSELKKITKRLAKIPEPSRQLFLIVVNRGRSAEYGDLQVSLPEIAQATNLTSGELRDCFSILDSHGFTQDNDIDDFGVQMVGCCTAPSGWPVWKDIKLFCKRVGADPALLIINLDFSVLDGQD